jgi:hypothetical protein
MNSQFRSALLGISRRTPNRSIIRHNGTTTRRGSLLDTISLFIADYFGNYLNLIRLFTFFANFRNTQPAVGDDSFECTDKCQILN